MHDLLRYGQVDDVYPVCALHVVLDGFDPLHYLVLFFCVRVQSFPGSAPVIAGD
jgi:hypothetical protein